MTFRKFKDQWEKEFLPNKDKELRDGQWLMICLANIWSNEYLRIVQSIGCLQEDLDCFYKDEKMQNTWDHLEKVWHNYPN